MGAYQAEFFIPAETPAEAISRIYALTGRTPERSRGEKRALVALLEALGLDVDMVETPARSGARLAAELEIEWTPDLHTERNTVTLAGLNALLEGATMAFQAGSIRQIRDNSPPRLSGPEWTGFRPARNKLEAVTRIAALTSAPAEWLGPGGKEHKSVLINLAAAVFPDMDTSVSKTDLAEQLASEFRVPWTETCTSTGYTISLEGLNTVLAGAERHLGLLGSRLTDLLEDPLKEGQAVAAALFEGLPKRWDGKQCVRWLYEQGLRGAFDNEWQGFFCEAKSRQVLADTFEPATTPPRSKYGSTVFDLALRRVWDLKTHTGSQLFPTTGLSRPGKNDLILNDESAVRECVAEQGLGFVVVSGQAEMDESGDFLAWHRAFKQQAGVKSAPSNSGESRVRKAAFTPTEIEVFWVENTEALNAAIASGRLVIRSQGRQAPKVAGEPGSPRPPKFHLNVRSAREDMRTVHHTWPEFLRRRR